MPATIRKRPHVLVARPNNAFELWKVLNHGGEALLFSIGHKTLPSPAASLDSICFEFLHRGRKGDNEYIRWLWTRPRGGGWEIPTPRVWGLRNTVYPSSRWEMSWYPGSARWAELPLCGTVAGGAQVGRTARTRAEMLVEYPETLSN